MNLFSNKMLLSVSILVTLFISGCSSLKIIDLKPQSEISNELKLETNSVVSIDELEVSGGRYKDAEKWQKGLADALRNEGVFQVVSQSRRDKSADFFIRGKVSGSFRAHGAKNFFTWWPGPLAFAQGWRGTRYIYDAVSDLELIDTESGKVIEQYHAESSYELQHRSYNPWHFFGTLFIFPGVIKGSVSVSPSAYYRHKIYEVAYPVLWKRMAGYIKEGQSKIYSQRVAMLQKRCAGHFNEEIKIGLIWSEFVSCQTRKFSFIGKESVESGHVSVYIRNDHLLRVHVADDGRILRWYIAKRPNE